MIYIPTKTQLAVLVNSHKKANHSSGCYFTGTHKRRAHSGLPSAYNSGQLYLSRSHFPSITSLFQLPWATESSEQRESGSVFALYLWGKWPWRLIDHRPAPGTLAWRWSCQWSRWQTPGRWESSVWRWCSWKASSEMEQNLVKNKTQRFLQKFYWDTSFGSERKSVTVIQYNHVFA